MYIQKTNPLELSHIKQHKTVYLFMSILLLTGIVFGAVIVNSMSFIQKQDLYFHLDRYFNQLIEGQSIPHKDIFTKSLFHHVKMLLVLFILGLSVIGLPIVWILVFIKGLVIGFSVGFIVNQLGFKGLLLATLSIAPQNMIMIPIYIIAGSFSMVYSLSLFHKLFNRSVSKPLLRSFIQYSAVFCLLLVGSIIGSFIESFISNEAFNLLLRYVTTIIMNFI